jgi:hypothetical protein
MTIQASVPRYQSVAVGVTQIQRPSGLAKERWTDVYASGTRGRDKADELRLATVASQ